MAEYLARHGADGATDLRWMDDADFDALFRRACDGGFSTFELGGGGCAELSEIEQDHYEDAVVDADVDPEKFDTRLEQLDVNEGSAKRVYIRTGPYGVELASQLDDAAFRQFHALDADAQQALVRAWRADKRISTANVEAVLVKRRTLARRGFGDDFDDIVKKTEEDGVRFMNQLDRSQLTKVFAAVKTHDVSNDNFAEFVSLSDKYADETVKDILRETDSGKSIAELMELDTVNKQSLIRLVYKSDSEFVDEELQPHHVLKVAKKEDLRDVRVMALGENNVHWMGEQDIEHAISRHVKGEYITKKDTSFFPTGRTIKTKRGKHKLPSSNMPGLDSKTELHHELKEIAYAAIKNGDESGGKIEYIGIQKYGISKIELNIDGTHVKSIYPTRGTKVHRWDHNSEKWITPSSGTQSRTVVWIENGGDVGISVKS